MIELNIFRAIGDFFTMLFLPLDYFRALQDNENWWLANSINVVLFLIGLALFIYWFIQLNKFRKEGTEDYN